MQRSRPALVVCEDRQWFREALLRFLHAAGCPAAPSSSLPRPLAAGLQPSTTVLLGRHVPADVQHLVADPAVGRVWPLGPTVTLDDVLGVAQGRTSGDREGARSGPTLTRREREVLQALAVGKSAQETAQALGLSARTVEGHRRRLFAKLQAQSAAHAVAAAAAHGLLGVTPS